MWVARSGHWDRTEPWMPDVQCHEPAAGNRQPAPESRSRRKVAEYSFRTQMLRTRGTVLFVDDCAFGLRSQCFGPLRQNLAGRRRWNQKYGLRRRWKAQRTWQKRRSKEAGLVCEYGDAQHDRQTRDMRHDRGQRRMRL